MLATEVQTTVLNRLKRIEGQMRGIQRLIESDCDCKDIMHQLLAARAATSSLAATLVEEYAKSCLEQPEKYGPPSQVISEMASMFRSLAK